MCKQDEGTDTDAAEALRRAVDTEMAHCAAEREHEEGSV